MALRIANIAPALIALSVMAGAAMGTHQMRTFNIAGAAGPVMNYHAVPPPDVLMEAKAICYGYAESAVAGFGEE